MARNGITSEEKCDAEKLLGLTGSYDKKMLKQSYSRMVREWHPDLANRNGHTTEEATKVTAQVNNAFVLLSGLFTSTVTTVQCGPLPEDVRSHAAEAKDGTNTQATWHAEQAHEGVAASGAKPDNGDYDSATEGSYQQTYKRGAVPRNMAAAMRYTRIVTDSDYMKWFVTGLGPHVVWAAACLAFLAAIGFFMSGVYGPASVLMWVQILPVAIVYDIATGKGAEIVGSVADIWAVNKAVKGAS